MLMCTPFPWRPQPLLPQPLSLYPPSPEADAWWHRFLSFTRRRSRECKIGALTLILQQLVAAGLASWLHALYQGAYEAWLDDREYSEAHTRDVLQRVVARNYGGGCGRKGGVGG